MSKLRPTLRYCFLFLALLIVWISRPAYAEETPLKINANAAIAIDADTGEIFFNQNADKPMGIASISKIISLYLIEQQIKEGKLAWDDPVPISKELSELSVNPELSNVPLEEKNYSVKELFDSAVIQSANASVMALAEKVAGSEASFVDLMRQQLLDWGITDAYIVTSTGLNNEDLDGHIYPGSKPTDENLLSARAVSIVARHLIQDYPDFLKVSSIRSQIFDENSKFPVEMHNSNRMLPGSTAEKAGVDGLKTGLTDLAGPCFVGTMTKDGRRIITVVLNAKDEDMIHGKFTETSKLMDYVFDNWTYQEIIAEGEEIQTLQISNAVNINVPLLAADSYSGWVQKDHGDQAYQLIAEMNYSNTNDIQAPIKKETVLGNLRIKSMNALGTVAEDTSPSIPLIVASDVDAVSNWDYLKRKMESISQKISRKFLE